MDELKAARPCLRAVGIPLNGCLHWVENVFLAPPLTLVFRRCLPRLFSSSFPLSNLLTHERAVLRLLGVPFRCSIRHLCSHSINASSIITLHIRTQVPTRSGKLSRVVACVVISVNI